MRPGSSAFGPEPAHNGGVTLLVFLIAAAVAASAVARTSRSSSSAWSEAADQLGLRRGVGRRANAWRLQGVVRGIEIRVEVTSRAKGHDGPATVYTATGPIPAPKVVFRRQHPTSFLRQFIGGRDVEVGDPRFDNAVVVDAQDEAAMRSYLTPARREAIMALFATWRHVVITERSLTITVPGRAREATEIRATVDRLVDTALALGPSTPTASPPPPPAPPPPVEPPPVAPTPVPPAPPTPVHEPVPAADTDAAPPPLDQQAVVDAVFSDERYGAAIDEHFRTHYQGSQVTWTGTVEHARGYRSDVDFGTTPGTRATLTIGTIGGSRLRSNRTRAVVDLPEGTTPARGDEITVRGTLLRLDRFTRTFLVENAEIVP